MPVLPSANVALPKIFTDNMVLQRGQAVPIWGTAAPGEEVTVSFAGQSKKTTAGATGKWRLNLDALEANAEPASLKVSGNNAIAINTCWSVRSGWGPGNRTCSGASGNPRIPRKRRRQQTILTFVYFRFRSKHTTTPQDDVDAKWDICTPERIPEFSAVLYYLAANCKVNSDVPIGLIQSAWGGTRVEPWTPLNGFSQVAALKEIHDAASARVPGTLEYATITDAYVTKLAEWLPKARQQLKKNQAIDPVPDPPNPLPRGHQTPIAIYNAMIHPIIPYAIKGALWYQGESNNGEGMLYYERRRR